MKVEDVDFFIDGIKLQCTEKVEKEYTPKNIEEAIKNSTKPKSVGNPNLK